MFVDIALMLCRPVKIVHAHNVLICKLLQKLNMPHDMKMLTYIVLKAYV